MRVHPVSYLLTRGIQFTLSSDDAGFFSYEGVTMDYTYAVAGWNLDLKDIKKMAMNGITYSSLKADEKKELMEKQFEPKWAEWVKMINAAY